MVVVDNAAADDDHWEIPSSFAKLKLLTAQIDLRQSIKRTLKLDASNTLSFKQLYQYAPRRAVYFSVLGLVAALLNSTLMPVMFMIYGGTTDLFISRVICKALEIYDILDICPVGVNDLNFHLHYKRCNLSLPGIPELPDHDLVEGVSRNSVYFTLIGIGTFIFAGTQIAAFSFACELTVAEVRKRLVRSIFELPVEWFDQNDAGVVSSLLIENVNKLKNGLGDKIGLIVQAVGTSLVAAIIGFARSWKLSLVMMAASPPLILASALATIVTVRSTNAEIKAYARAGAVAQQSIRNIRTVQAFGGQRKMIDQYQSHLGQAKKEGIKKSTINGLMLSTLWFTIFATYALGFWYGSRLEDAGEISVGDLLTVFLGIQTAIFTLGNALPHVTSANEARAAGFDLYRLIDEPGETSPAQKAPDFAGKDIVFENVSFRYPTRPEVKVLDDFCLTIPAGKTTAFVGESGCGKSTLVQLLLRYYTPQSGKILIGGKDIQSFDLRSYRSHLGLVSQEPVLFSSSIEENIRLGKMLCSRDEIEQVCRISNAHEFISDLPAGYETNVGESGSSLSGGQKQRIAIARALVGDPSVLLLDEATSALDSESERHVQKTLEQASQGRTTLIIAHRLSTIRNADLIVGLSKGKIVEMGTHDQLMALEGIYSGLVKANEKQDDSDFDWSAKQIESRQRARSLRALTSISRKSSTSHQQQLTTESIVPSEKAKNVTRFMFSMNRPELIYILVGCVSCAGFGLMQTLFELYFARIVVAFGICFKDTRVNEINSNCIIFVVFAVMSMIAQIVSSFSFAISGENLTKRLRTAIFELLMRYDIGFFDDPNNSVGSLCTMLASEASAVHGATGIRVGVVLANFFILGTGAILALVYGWMLALVIAAFIPLIIVSGLLSIRLSGKFDSYEKKFLEQAGRIAVEATSNIRTVKQLNTQQFFADKYVQIMDEAFRKNAKKCILTGLLFGFSQGVIFFTLATGYYAGSHFVAREMMNIEELMIVFAGMLFASMAVGQNQAMAPEHGKSRAAAVKIYDILHDQPEMDSMSHTGNIPATFQGKYEFRNVDFSYPSRDSVQVLRKFNWTVEKGTDVALVGPSGCGKSTIIQLMERYYDPTNGEIILDGQNLKNVNIGWYRKQLGLVGQEPVLFDWSIAENIRFGDTSRADIAIDEIRFVANIANVDDFICKLPNGYDTRVGSKGALMSGGQKQRICIARSLIRDPKLLMLDEATSALDAESEKLVQEAIEDAQKQRGSVTIAHKLKTIENSDEICVLSRGKVVEQGKHEELLKMDGLYTDLYKLSAR